MVVVVVGVVVVRELPGLAPMAADLVERTSWTCRA